MVRMKGWTVLQRRSNGTIDFYRNWQDYRNGFGDLRTEFWLGNEKIHQLTNQGQYAYVEIEGDSNYYIDLLFFYVPTEDKTGQDKFRRIFLENDG
jgi:hypothetical protein